MALLSDARIIEISGKWQKDLCTRKRGTAIFCLDSKSRTSMWAWLPLPNNSRDREVLEIATGPGVIAKQVAAEAKSMIATDFSEKMLAVAHRGEVPDNLKFEQADACKLQYADDSFDVVIIANALHIIPEPERALAEIRRVLRKDGILIARTALLPFLHETDLK